MRRHRWRRWYYRARVRGTPLADCWARPWPSTRQAWLDYEYLVCDAEMSALEVARGELLSLGWVVVEGGQVRLDSAAHHLVAASRSVGQSAGIHQLRDCDLHGAEPEALVLRRLCEAARGRILVFHHAPLDLAYLDRASRRLFSAPLLLPYLDTLAIEQRRRERLDTAPQPGALTLTACRRRYGLPDYPAHNALVDAVATAELLLAIASHRGGVDRQGRPRPARLGDLSRH
ncbi:3'-5' exonuclease [Parahaliea mediterranea]|uniref:3'-5' exonuclease n=1 Tax=Parahaliea mediterranea TaxID=651086 RepID=A0A939IJS2_9GAMM|nr:3'-5' exonuclease [Parahaliea mediterranea]MBN7796591.1 3'-5' exonuclease [Parahaliea mediterranea]